MTNGLQIFKKILLISCIVILFTTNTLYAQEKARVFPSQGLLTFQGLDDTSSPPIVKDGRAADIQNINLDITGQANKRNGYSVFGINLDTNHVDDDFEAVTGLWELFLSSGTKVKLATVGSNLFNITSSAKTDITQTLSITEGQNNQFAWTTALDQAIGTNDTDVPIKTNGTTSIALDVSDLSDTLTKAKTVVWWKNYLIFGNTLEGAVERPTRIRWSNVGTIETWSDDDFIDISALGGQEIEAFGVLYDNLYIFLTDSIYKVSLVGGDDLFISSKVSEGVGCIAKNSAKTIAIGNSEGIIFLSRDKRINYLDGVKVTEISTLIRNTMNDLSAARLKYAVAVDDRRNTHYYLAVTDGSVATNNLVLDFNYEIGEWSKHIQIDANAFMTADDDNNVKRVFFGNYESFIYQMIDPDLDNDVDGLSGTFSNVTGFGNQDAADTLTASGLTVLYDTTADFSATTGATVSITSGTGSGEEYIVVQPLPGSPASGIIVVDSTVTATGTSVYSIGAIDAYYTTKWYDLGLAPVRKNFGEMYLWTTTTATGDITVSHGTDFVDTITTSTAILQADGSLWGTAIWGTDEWAGTSSSLSKIPINNSGRFIKYKFREADIDETMGLMGYSTIFWPLEAF